MIAKVIVAKCTDSKQSISIRAQKEGNDWIFTWTFKLTEKNAGIEGYDKDTISGRILFDKSYPGCPYCGANGFAQCGHCQKIMCSVGNEREITCPHCGHRSHMEITDTFDNISGDMF
ncbi:MAG: hypothetical protein JXB49_02635 [Bacteroidales bacterium]|nr:hypothetical protein [Bacteroidales bacterium]MBN2864157.1 hypothetical protein [Bacteroidales bacterium]